LSQVSAFAADSTSTPAMAQAATPAPMSQQQPASGERSTTPADHAAMSRQHIERIQQALNSAGDKTAIDGKWGPKTEAALKQFQQKHGIKATGRLDQATRKRLHATG
jgi:peptidoglycan DL-endopeptidase CwlO